MALMPTASPTKISPFFKWQKIALFPSFRFPCLTCSLVYCEHVIAEISTRGVLFWTVRIFRDSGCPNLCWLICFVERSFWMLLWIFLRTTLSAFFLPLEKAPLTVTCYLAINVEINSIRSVNSFGRVGYHFKLFYFSPRPCSVTAML